MTRVPSPSVDSISIVPPICSTISRQMARPRPLPSIPACSSRARRKKGSKTFPSRVVGDAEAVISDDNGPVVHLESAADADVTPLRRVFQGVGNQVAEDLLAARGVGRDRDVGSFQGTLPGNPPLGGLRHALAVDLADEGAEGECAETERPVALHEPSVVEIAPSQE